MIDNLLRMTWYNPIFMFVAIGALWFLPGILFRRIAENRYQKKIADEQAKKIA